MLLIALTSLLAGADLLAQPEDVSFNQKNTFITLKRGEMILFYKNKNAAIVAPVGGIVIADSVSYIMSENDFKQKIYYRMKTGVLDTLITLYRDAKKNLESQRELMLGQIELEKKFNAQALELLNTKKQIAEDAIAELKKRKFRAILYTFALGATGGALWTKETDAGAVKWLKPLGLGLASAYVSIQFNLN